MDAFITGRNERLLELEMAVHKIPGQDVETQPLRDQMTSHDYRLLVSEEAVCLPEITCFAHHTSPHP